MSERRQKTMTEMAAEMGEPLDEEPGRDTPPQSAYWMSGPDRDEHGRGRAE